MCNAPNGMYCPLIITSQGYAHFVVHSITLNIRVTNSIDITLYKKDT